MSSDDLPVRIMGRILKYCRMRGHRYIHVCMYLWVKISVILVKMDDTECIASSVCLILQCTDLENRNNVEVTCTKVNGNV